MLNIPLRTAILYFTVVFIFRVMGKRQIGELQPSELVLAIMVSDLATIPMETENTPLYLGIIPIITLMFVELFISYFSQKSVIFRRVLTGAPEIIISKGKIDVKVMKHLRFNLDDLFEQLRSSGYMSVSEVEYAILETNGQLSIIPKQENIPVTVDILRKIEKDGLWENKNAPEPLLPRNVIKDGKVSEKNLQVLGLDINWLNKKLEENNISSPKKVFLFTTDGKSSYIQRKD